jgi:peptidoglycan/LPS O-acetylase OafA/YrhL
LLVGVTMFRPLAGEAFTLAALLSAVLVDWLLAARPQPGVVGRALAPLGLASYSVYLCHSPLIYALRGVLSWLGMRPSYWLDWSVALAAVAAAIYGVSWLLGRTVEQRGLRLGRRLWDLARSGHGRRQAA